MIALYTQACFVAGEFPLQSAQPLDEPPLEILGTLFMFMSIPATYFSPVILLLLIFHWHKSLEIRNVYLILYVFGSIFFILAFWFDLFRAMHWLAWD